MPSLILRFPAGRYHATPWGHHVNEGLIEWPPAPWRILRALLATGYAKLHWPTSGPPAIACQLIEKLACRLPCYRLPKASGAHSRHYMPFATLDKGREKTSLVFDTWARVEGEMVVSWDIELEPAEHELFASLITHLGYLGRSESWVVARLMAADEPLPTGTDCWPEEKGAPAGPGWEQVPLIAPLQAEEYELWRQDAVGNILSGLPQPKPGKKLTAKMEKDYQKAVAPYPQDIIACLLTQTSDWKSHGWNQPPGSRQVFYWRRADSLEIGQTAHYRSLSAQSVAAVLLSMSTASNNDHALPYINRTLPQSEMLHRQLVGYLKGKNNPALTGKDDRRVPLRGPHQHAHILPLDLDGDDHLDHILIWADMGLDDVAQAAIRATRKTFTKGGVGPLRLAWAAAGELDDLLYLPGDYGERLKLLLQKSSEWISATPFVPPRYLKKKGSNTLEGQIEAELASRNLPQPVLIERIYPQDSDLACKQRHFIRSRRGKNLPLDCGFTIRLRFKEPISGPVCIGYGSHFGLGMFRATTEKTD